MLVNLDPFEDSVLRINKKLQNHHFMTEKRSKNLNKLFSFDSVTRSDIGKSVLCLGNSKASQNASDIYVLHFHFMKLKVL